MTQRKYRQKRKIFVAHPYNLYDNNDYRRIFVLLGQIYGVKFIFADEKITNMYLLEKIKDYIRDSDFSIFDISGWNPNVTLELGMALAERDNDWYICFNPDMTDFTEVPSDIRGIDRIEYRAFSELEKKVRSLLEERYIEKESLSNSRIGVDTVHYLQFTFNIESTQIYSAALHSKTPEEFITNINNKCTLSSEQLQQMKSYLNTNNAYACLCEEMKQ